VHHFFLAICTHPGSGVCFKDNGWYHRESDVATDLDESRGSGKIYNKILSKVLKVLKVNEDVRQQELALKIMTACPELVPRFGLYSSVDSSLTTSL
jgi:nucleolar pre-ribosomal-associated protein 1